MKVLIDADACPVTELTIQLCTRYHIHCIILCDTAHQIHRQGAETLVFDKGADCVDFALVNRAEPGDLVITQDYGLASMCLARNARVLHQDGWEYTQYNIQALLFQRAENRRYRTAGGRIKGPSKRKPAQNAAFEKALAEILQQAVQG